MAAQLRLVTEETVVQFPAREPSTFDQAWACRTGMMRKRGDGSDKTRKLWEKAAKKVGSARLLDALKRYLREEKEPKCGYPGLSVWLNGERYDHWMQEPRGADGQTTSSPDYPHRKALIETLGEPFVLSYLDPCTFHEDGYITPASNYAKGKLIERARDLKAAGIVGIRKRE